MSHGDDLAGAVELRLDRWGDDLALSVPHTLDGQLIDRLHDAGVQPRLQLRETAAVADHVPVFLDVSASTLAIAAALREFFRGRPPKSKISARVGGNVVEAEGMDADAIVRIINALKDE